MVNNKIEGNHTINEDTEFHGMITGSAIVKPHVTLVLHGMINEDLELQESSVVLLHGIVNGNVINNGGELQVFGTINGKLIKHSGINKINSDSIIDGVKQ